MKIAIVTDSNSGITQAQAGELGIFVLPMPFMINGETFEEDINLRNSTNARQRTRISAPPSRLRRM